MNGNTREFIADQHYSIGKAPPGEDKPMGAMAHVRDSGLSINTLEKAVDALAESLADVLAGDIRSIASASGGATAEPSTGSTICDAIVSNDARVRAMIARVENLNSRLRV